jgi:hypothetical protein
VAKQFIAQNRGLLCDFGVVIEPEYDGSQVELLVKTGTQIGAIPLLSPTTGRPDYGLVIKPRFEWAGLGPMLGVMGWRILPTPLRLPLLPRSDRKVPPWVLSTILLVRLKALLDRLDRRFEIVAEQRPAPRGTVDWAAYATRQVSRGRFLDVPCRFPDLRDDRDLKGAIHFTLRKLLQGLEGQRAAGSFVLQLITLCQTLLHRVRETPPYPPTPTRMQAWFRGPLRTEAFREGLQAINWTVEDRGLAGLSDLEGLPWAMSMEEFFEAWVEVVFRAVAVRIGGVIRTGRERQTVTPLHWQPPYLGSQKYLLPDFILEREEQSTIIADAKYKEHWEEMGVHQWRELGEELRARHRADLLQVLAYANVPATRHVIVCLIYPCRYDTWRSLVSRDRLFHRASLLAGTRLVEIVLTAVPMYASLEPVGQQLANAFR